MTRVNKAKSLFSAWAKKDEKENTIFLPLYCQKPLFIKNKEIFGRFPGLFLEIIFIY